MQPLIGVLSSYTLEPMDGVQSPTFNGLVQGLSQRGRTYGKDYLIEISHSNSLEKHEAALRKWLYNGVDLLFSGGTPTCALIRKVLKETGQHKPVVYYGAHPINGTQDVALADCLHEDTACVRIELPLTYSHRNFRLLRLLFPDLQTVHIPFARNTAFCHRDMAANYDHLAESQGSFAWASGQDVGFASIRDLCWLIDAEYREYPLYRSSDLRQALCSISSRSPSDPITDVIVAFNDTFHIADSPHVLLDYSARTNVPLVWVNNANMAKAGACADFCNPFAQVAQQAAQYVDEFLSGRWQSGRKTIEWNHDTLFTMNRQRLLEIGVPEEVVNVAKRYFQETTA